MNDKLKNIVSFFKTRKISAEVGPEIEVDYHCYSSANDDVKLALKAEWEKLRKEIDANPACIKEQEWNEYFSDRTRQETLTVDIDGVVLELKGPYYPNPNYSEPEPKPRISDEQQGNECVDGLLKQTNLIWAITHCSSVKFETFIDFVEATRKTRTRIC